MDPPPSGSFFGSNKVKGATAYYQRFLVADKDDEVQRCDVGDFVLCQAGENKVRWCSAPSLLYEQLLFNDVM